MDREIDFFAGDVDNIQLLVIDFVRDCVCDTEGCGCGMDYPWAVIAEVAIDEYSVRDSDDEEETDSQVIIRADSVEAALLSLRLFEEEYDSKWSVILTDAAHYCFRLEASFKEGLKTGNINWEDIIFDEPS